MNPLHYGLEPFDQDAPPKPREGFSRRDFLVTSIAGGFALASSPIHAQAIHTDSAGLVAGEVKVPVKGGAIPAYRAMPAKAKNAPLMLVAHEIFGVHEHIQDLCRRFAKQGYYAIAPSLYAREGDVGKLSDISAILGIVNTVPDAQVMSDLDATLAFAKASGHADVSRAAIVGFCWGGRVVWLYTHHNPKMKAGIAYYGLLTGSKSEIKPADPVDIAATLKVPVLGLYAGKDAFIGIEQVEQMRAQLAKGASGSQLLIFPGVDHGFNADYRPTYDRATAEYAAELRADWLRDHGL